jgi:hypothetical protein
MGGCQVAPFCLIDTDTANLVGAYATEAEALQAVAEMVALHGRQSEAVTSLALVRDDVPAGEGYVASGSELVARAGASIGG